MNVETIKTQFKSLRLPTASVEIDEVLNKQKKAVNLAWAVELLEREIDARKEKALKLRMRQAGFPEQTTLETFDWNFNPEIDQTKIQDLATLKFIEENQIALFLGAPGVGKSHIALAIAIKAVTLGHRVFWTSSKRLSQQIVLYKSRGALDILFKKMLSSRLWIIDDWGVVSMNREVAEEMFDLLDRRKHNSAMILTSNRDINEWGEVFPDPVIANATIDRIFDRAKLVLFKGKSYRLKGRIKTKEIDMAKKSD
jgi:DNA replication protein DnaC